MSILTLLIRTFQIALKFAISKKVHFLTKAHAQRRVKMHHWFRFCFQNTIKKEVGISSKCVDGGKTSSHVASGSITKNLWMAATGASVIILVGPLLAPFFFDPFVVGSRRDH